MRRNAYKICIAVMFLAGVAVLCYPHVSNMIYKQQAAEAIKDYQSIIWGLSQEECDALFEDAEAYNQSLVKKPDQFALTNEEYAAVATYLNPTGTGQMGYLTIPKIDVEIPIYQGTEEKQLQAGAGWWIGTSLPTGGESTHCVLSAHNGLVKAKLFTDLEKLEIGDTFYLTVLDRMLTYEVDQILVTEPGEHEPLSIVPGEDLVTLYTCTPYGVNTHRLLVRGHRIATPESVDVQQDSSAYWWLLLLLPVAALLFLLVWRKRKRAAGRKGEKDRCDEEENEAK